MENRKLYHSKAKQIKVTDIPPINTDGQNGDMQLIRSSNINNNELLYIKIDNEWKIIGLEDVPSFTEERTIPNIKEIHSRNNLTINAPNGFTSPNTPCFSAYNSTTDTNLVGDGSTWTTIDFDTEVFDVGSNFASDTFTAPITGKYFFTAGVTVVQQNVDKWIRMQIHTSGGSFSNFGWQHDDAVNYTTHSVSCLVALSASETAIVRVQGEADGNDAFDIIGGAAETYFQGYRIA